MKATLEFELPEEKEDFEMASNAYKYRMALTDFDNYLRAKLKYEELPNESIYEALSEARQKLNEICEENEVSIF